MNVHGGLPSWQLPWNRDGSLSRNRSTDLQKLYVGVMTAAQLTEHTSLQKARLNAALSAWNGAQPRLTIARGTR